MEHVEYIITKATTLHVLCISLWVEESGDVITCPENNVRVY